MAYVDVDVYACRHVEYAVCLTTSPVRLCDGEPFGEVHLTRPTQLVAGTGGWGGGRGVALKERGSPAIECDQFLWHEA